MFQEKKYLKGSVWLDMVVEMRMQYCRDFFRIHLRPMRRFYSTNSNFQILIDS